VSSDDDEEGNFLAAALSMGGGRLERLLREQARWTEVPPAPREDRPRVVTPVQNMARMMLEREFGPIVALAQAGAGVRRARSEANRAWHNEWVATHGQGALAPPLPPLATAAAAQPSGGKDAEDAAAEQLADEGGLMIMSCIMLDAAEAVHDAMQQADATTATATAVQSLLIGGDAHDAQPF
jgi:hypothetical protein